MRALVTGASRGIGRAIAEALLARGDRVVGVARSRASLAHLNPPAGFGLAADLSDAEAGEACVERAAELLGGLDAVVLAAGIAEHRPLAELSTQSLELQLQVNFITPLRMARAAVPALETHGAILFVGSTLGLYPAAGTVAYAASKAAVHAATRALAAELAPAVRVNAVAPGAVDTDMIRARPADEVDAIIDRYPLGLGRPQDIAEAALYLLDAPWVTGTLLTIDGGGTLC